MAGASATPSASLWPNFAEHILACLTDDDDPALWSTAIETVIRDAERASEGCRGRARVIVQLGCCSHWLAPNKARWITEDGEFTWPSGYETKGRFFQGLPEYDWHAFWVRNIVDNAWRHVPEVRAKRPLRLRVVFPARTGLRRRASIHAMWTPGPQAELNRHRLFYGFRRINSVWQCRAYQGPKGYHA